MLWTDADFIDASDMLSLDPEVNDIVAAEGVVLSGSTGVIRRGLEDAGRLLERRLVSFGNYLSSADISSNHLAAVFYTGGQATQKRRATLEQVVVNGRNANYYSDAKHWALFRVMQVFYRTVVNRSSNDRYEHKLNMFRQQEAAEVWPAFKKSGIPVVYRPMPCPGATQAYEPGTWSVTTSVGSGTVGTYDVAITYVDGSKYLSPTSKGNGESHPSARVSATTTSSQVLRIDITNLNPPTGTLTPEAQARGFTLPLSATAWNVYVGTSGQALYLQNATPIPIATKTFTLPAGPTLSGSEPGLGQYAEAYLTIMDLLQRG